MKIFKKPFLNLWPIRKNLPSGRSGEQTPEKKPENKYLNYLSVAGLVVFVSAFLYFYPDGKNRDTISVTSGEAQSAAIGGATAFENISLEAKAAFVFDIPKNEPLFELNAEIQLPLASLTKIMTAIVAEENLPQNLIVEIPPEAILQEGDSGFKTGEEWPISDLKNVMLLISSNDAAFALSWEYDKKLGKDGDFVALMNKKVKEMKLAQTYFLNPNGLDLSKNAAGAYGSAEDTAKMLLYAVNNHYSLMEITRYSKAAISGREFENTDKIINDLPGFMAGKTGFSDLAGGNLAVVTDLGYGHPIIIVVLGSTQEGRFDDVKKLYNAAVSDIINL